MAKRNKSGMDILASVPWQAGFFLGILAYFVARYGIGWMAHVSGNTILQGLTKPFSDGSIPILPLMPLIICWIGAFISFTRSRNREHLLETQTGIESLRAMSWRQFETLVGEAFRRRGYTVEETGLGGEDGGVDLKLRRDGQLELVQCKQWRTQQVGVDIVRAMWGVVMHERANGVKIVCVGRFTPAAIDFARGKAIDLIDGTRLLELIREVQNAPPTKAAAPARIIATATNIESSSDRFKPPLLKTVPACPQCGSTMIQRVNKTTKDPFWGCSGFPKCRGTKEFSA